MDGWTHTHTHVELQLGKYSAIRKVILSFYSKNSIQRGNILAGGDPMSEEEEKGGNGRNSIFHRRLLQCEIFSSLIRLLSPATVSSL